MWTVDEKTGMPNTIPFLTMITVLDNQTADLLTVREELHSAKAASFSSILVLLDVCRISNSWPPPPPVFSDYLGDLWQSSQLIYFLPRQMLFPWSMVVGGFTVLRPHNLSTDIPYGLWSLVLVIISSHSVSYHCYADDSFFSPSPIWYTGLCMHLSLLTRLKLDGKSLS